MVYLSFGADTSYLTAAGTSGRVVIIDLTTMEPCFVEESGVASEIIYMSHRKSATNPMGQIAVVNMDQNMFIYDVSEHKVTKGSLNKRLNLQKTASMCLYLDEVIDVKFIHRDSKFVLLCSNSETLKLLDTETR